MIIVWALYGLKTSSTAWHATFAQKLVEMGYTLSKADPNMDKASHQDQWTSVL